MAPGDRLIVAIDRSDRYEIASIVEAMKGVAGYVKIGLQAFVANGPGLVREIVDQNVRVFLDLKIHDIPNTAKRAVEEAQLSGASIITVHASGGSAMMKACAAVAQSDVLVAGVTLLTSLDEDSLSEIGFAGTAAGLVARLGDLAVESGLRCVVASPLETEALRSRHEDLVIITPGIRPSGSNRNDQRRTMTPGDAIRAGASHLVVGRPITDDADSRGAAMRIVEEIAGAVHG